MTDTTKKQPTKPEPTYADQLRAAQALVERTDAAVEKAARAAYGVVRAYKAVIEDKPPAWAHAGADAREKWLALAKQQLTQPFKSGDCGVEDGIASAVIGHVLQRELGVSNG